MQVAPVSCLPFSQKTPGLRLRKCTCDQMLFSGPVGALMHLAGHWGTQQYHKSLVLAQILLSHQTPGLGWGDEEGVFGPGFRHKHAFPDC